MLCWVFRSRLPTPPRLLAVMQQPRKLAEGIGGALLLSNCYVPLALTVLAPVVVNIVAFHLFLAPSGLAIPIVVLALGVFLAWSYRAAFKPMLRADVSPDTATERAASRTARAA